MVATCVGNAVEWYDFAIYGALGVLVTPLFFPSRDSATVLLVTFSVYATAFVVRPLGAVVFGSWPTHTGANLSWSAWCC
ncbi:MAG: hypothetical protein ACXWDM_00220 [Nocardioides sp.]